MHFALGLVFYVHAFFCDEHNYVYAHDSHCNSLLIQNYQLQGDILFSDFLRSDGTGTLFSHLGCSLTVMQP